MSHMRSLYNASVRIINDFEVPHHIFELHGLNSTMPRSEKTGFVLMLIMYIIWVWVPIGAEKCALNRSCAHIRTYVRVQLCCAFYTV